MSRLTDLDIVEISIVREPANQREFLLYKSRSNNMTDELTFSAEKSSYEENEEFKKFLDEQDIGEDQEIKLRASLRAIEKFKEEEDEEKGEEFLKNLFKSVLNLEDEEREEQTKSEGSAQELASELYRSLTEKAESGEEQDDSGENKDVYEDQKNIEKMHPEKVRAVIEGLKTAMEGASEDAQENISQAIDELSGMIGESYPMPKRKSLKKEDLPEETREQLDKLMKEKDKTEEQLQEVKKQLKKQREKERIEKHKEKVEKNMSHLTEANADKDLATVLKEIEDHDKDLYEEIEKVLVGANEQIEKSGFFEEQGSSRERTGGLSSLEEKAKEISDKEGVSYDKAFEKAMEQNPELYKEYKEKRK